MVRQAHHEQLQPITVHTELVEGRQSSGRTVIETTLKPQGAKTNAVPANV
jgi:hypothetical protein